MTAAPAISFQEVDKTFRHRGMVQHALRGVSLDIARGDIHAVIGHSGAGKSTLLRTVNALERPSSGRVLVAGQEISSLRGRPLLAARAGIGMVFQQFNLLRSRTVYQNIAYPLRLAGRSQDQILDRIEELLDFVGLTEHALSYPSRLSGGQKQRVGIARALATAPEILISDEATSALDPETTAEVLELLQRVNRKHGITILLVTHEMDAVARIADRVTVMQEGAVIESGAVHEVFSDPQTATARSFVSSVLQHVPEGRTLAALRASSRGRLVQVRMGPELAGSALLTRIAREHGVDADIVFGGLSEMQGHTFGSLTVDLLGRDERIEDALRELRRRTAVDELSENREAAHADH